MHGNKYRIHVYEFWCQTRRKYPARFASFFRKLLEYDKEKDDVNENTKLKKAVIDSFEEFKNKQLELFKNQKEQKEGSELLLKNS